MRTGELYISQLNVQSVRPLGKRLELNHELATHGYDILVLNETWLKPGITNRFITVPGYQILRADRPSGSGYGGIALVVRDGISVKTVTAPDRHNQRSRLESLCVRVQCGASSSVMIYAAYRPPYTSAQQDNDDIDELDHQLQHMLIGHSGMVLVVGDFNFDQSGRASGPAFERFGALFTDCSMTQLITDATYRPSGSVLDLIFTNRAASVIRAGTVRCNISPHNFTRAIVRLPLHRPPQATVTARKWAALDPAELNGRLDGVDWSPVFDSEDPAVQWDYFVSRATRVLDELAPVRRVKIRNPTAPPVSDVTKALMADRRAALRDGDREWYKRLNRQVRSSILTDSRSAIRERLRDGGPSAVWRSVRPVVAGKRDGAAQPTDVDVDALNRYFVNLGPRTVAQIDRSGPDLPVRLPRVSTSAFALRTISLGDLRCVLSRMRSSTSAGVDGLCIKFVKMCFPTIGSSLLRIVNTSLRTGTVPDSWKVSLIHPIPKAGNSSDLSNFRPISIVPTIAKVVERIVQEQLYRYFNGNHLFNANQHGFRSQHSTETALLSLTDKVHHAMDSSHISLLVLLDLSKCFDVVDHARLLEKLRLYGVCTRWFESYLSNHRQQVVLSSRAVGRRLSRALPNPLGTYQGSALGPLLYSIYSNDMPLYAEDADIIQYADDTQVLVSGPKNDMIRNVSKMERSLAGLSLWFRKNAMKLNTIKTQLIVFGSRQNLKSLPPVSVKIDNTSINESQTVKNLGVIFDRHLLFDSHIDHLVRRCTGMLLSLCHAKHGLPAEVLPRIVDGLVMSSVRYCVSVYGATSGQLTQRIQKCINFCARVLSGKRKFDHISGTLRSLGWLSAGQLHQYYTLMALRRLTDSSEPEALAALFVMNRETHTRTTRASDRYRLPRIRNEQGRKRFAYRAAMLENALPSAVRETPGGRKAFGRALKRHMLSTA